MIGRRCQLISKKNTGALIITAGKTEYREGFDPMHKVGSISAVQRLVRTFVLAGADPIVLVMGPQSEEMEKQVTKLGAVLLKNPDPDAQMFSNVRMGLSYLQDKCGQALITPVDVPLFTAQTAKVLAESGKQLAIPVCKGVQGHPLLIGAELFQEVLSYEGDGGLRGAVAGIEQTVTLIEVSDPGVNWQAGDTEDAADAIARHELAKMHPDVRVCVAKEQVFWGPGIRQMLYLIHHTGSVRLASQQMGISYSKAWKMLASLEQGLGFTVVSRQQGGRYGGEAHLTAAGQEITQRFVQYEQECKAMAAELFLKHFPEAE